jgi:DnaK suppressor protein
MDQHRARALVANERRRIAALAATLQNELAAVVRAETRIAEGTFGLSIESGAPIPDDRLEAEPLAERTVEEQSAFERSQR